MREPGGSVSPGFEDLGTVPRHAQYRSQMPIPENRKNASIACVFRHRRMKNLARQICVVVLLIDDYPLTLFGYAW